MIRNFWGEPSTLQNAIWMSDFWVATPYSSAGIDRVRFGDTEIDVLGVGGDLYATDIVVCRGEDVRSLDYASRRTILLKCDLPSDIIPEPVMSRTADFFHLHVADGGEGIFLKDLNAKYGSLRGVYAVPRYDEVNVFVTGWSDSLMSIACRGGNGLFVDLGEIEIPDDVRVGPELLCAVGKVWIFDRTEVGSKRWVEWVNLPLERCVYSALPGDKDWDVEVAALREEKIRLYSEETKKHLGVL
jgi:hypothetical protein